MPIPDPVGFAKFWAEYGTVAAFLMLFALIGLLLLIVKIRGFIIRFEEAASRIEILTKAHMNSEGKAVKIHEHHSRIQEMLFEIKTLLGAYQEHADKHYDDVERLSNEEKWRNCPIDKCPNFPKILVSYQELIAKFEIFQIHAVESRDRMNESMDRMADELSNIGHEFIAAWRLQLESEKGNVQRPLP